MAYDIKSPNTGESVAAQIQQRKIWQKGVEVFEQSTDFFQQMEGAGRQSVIQTKTDTEKGAGQKITFDNMSGLYAEPHMAEELFENEEDFEKLQFGEFDLEVDFLRHAVRYTARTEEFMGMRGEITKHVPDELGKWLGRIKTEMLFMTFLHKINAENVVCANGKSQDTLTSVDVLDWDEIIGMNAQLGRMGGTPAYVGKNGNQRVRAGVVVAATDSLFSLELDPSYRQLLRETNDLTNAKLIFNGGYSKVRGNVILPYNPVDHDGVGAIGSPINAKAYLGKPIVSGTDAIRVTGGGNPKAADLVKIKFFKYFPGYAYRFLIGDVLTVDATKTRYFLIVNPPNATDAQGGANKIGMYSYTTGNDGNGITITGRLAATASGTAKTALGNVTWNTGVWAGKHTDQHPAGALILPCNANGVAFGDTLFLYSKAAYRGYGKYRNRRDTENHNGNFVYDVFVTTVFGQTPVRDRLGRCPGVLRLRHAVQYAGVPLPTVT
ncbi:MAG: DUF4043 family protein [Verrucomicrobiales bacterium]|jgi:hypothetical protein|nr:DUF4043 family protein [Verrucomicrobiales bacterium]